MKNFELYDKNSLSSCKKALKICNKIYNISFGIFMFYYATTAFTDVFLMFFMPFILVYAIDFLTKVVGFYFACIVGASQRNNKGCFIALAIAVLSLFLEYASLNLYDPDANGTNQSVDELNNYTIFVNIGVTTITAIVVLIAMILNKIFHELEQLEGYPYFNERIEEIKEENKTDKYQNYLDEIKARHTSDNMDNIDFYQDGSMDLNQNQIAETGTDSEADAETDNETKHTDLMQSVNLYSDDDIYIDPTEKLSGE